MPTSSHKKSCRIVLTGGPGGGKTTALDLFRREIGEKVVIVPEVATILYRGGFPRSQDPGVKESAQKAIYHVQINLEAAQAAHFKNRILLCDRGTVDGGAYWPGPYQDFFTHMNTSLEKEFSRYYAVLFFETASVGGIFIEGGNPIRIESTAEAVELDHKLRDIWSQHENFIFIPHRVSFIEKMNFGLTELKKIVAQLSLERGL
jgi:predicted ATPase